MIQSGADHLRQGHGALGWIDGALIAFGLGCLVVFAVLTVQSAVYQRQAKAQVDAMIAARHLEESAASARRPPDGAPTIAPVMPGDVIGRVDVPRLKLSAAVAEGDDDSTLGKAVGHLPDTPLPWQPGGNVALAAHRDTLFRPLKDIRINDEVRVATAHGEFLYRVRRTQIVEPEDVSVIAPTARPTLTLITCYPFYFVGNAPHRFIVQAERVDPEPGPMRGSRGWDPEPAGVAMRGTVVQ
jgi:sortase A